MLFVVCWFFFQIKLFGNILSGILSECQTVWTQIRPDDSSGLIWVQTVCQDYQQTTLVDKDLSVLQVIALSSVTIKWSLWYPMSQTCLLYCSWWSIEPLLWKSLLWGWFWLAPLTQTGLYNPRGWLEAWNFLFRKKMDWTIHVAKQRLWPAA